MTKHKKVQTMHPHDFKICPLLTHSLEVLGLQSLIDFKRIFYFLEVLLLATYRKTTMEISKTASLSLSIFLTDTS